MHCEMLMHRKHGSRQGTHVTGQLGKGMYVNHVNHSTYTELRDRTGQGYRIIQGATNINCALEGDRKR